jgi:hypothetical protein
LEADLENPVLYLPLASTAISLVFAIVVFLRYKKDRTKVHLLWWSAGILAFGAGTIVEGTVALIGWREGLFRSWYITGALLGGAPLAQGTVYLLFSRRTANLMAIAVFSYVAAISVLVLLTPVEAQPSDEHRLAADVIEWTWVRAFSPLANTYAVIFLIGGAIYSAVQYRKMANSGDQVLGNILIAVGAILPGIGGSFTRAGFVEVLYITEFVGIILIFMGYHYNVKSRPSDVSQLRARRQAVNAGR